MNKEKFIQPKEIQIGEKNRLFCISKIPALEAQEIYSEVCKSVSENGYIGITMLSPSVVKRIMNYVAYCDEDGMWLSLGSDPVLNATFSSSFGDLQEVVIAMVKENFDFFVSGRLLDRLAESKAETD